MKITVEIDDLNLARDEGRGRYEQMERFFDIVPEIPTGPEHRRKVRQLGWKLGCKSK